MKKLLIAGMLTLLAGCKVDVEVPIDLSLVNSKEITESNLSMFVEVPSCNSYEDSRKESDGLIRIKNEMQKAFSEAKYKQCFTKKMNSLAEFTLPFVIYPATKKPTEEDKKIASKSAVTVWVSTPPEQLSGIFDVEINKKFKKKLITLSDKIMSSIQTQISISLTNDFEAPYFVSTGVPVYFNGEANYPNMIGVMPPKSNVLITLSNVTTDALMDNENNASWTLSIGTEEQLKQLQQQVQQ